MIHLIYIYFIINAFIAGLVYSDSDNWGITLCWLLFGCLSPLYLLWNWLDKILEVRTLFYLYFTNFFKDRLTPEMHTVLRNTYKKETRLYKRWVIRQVDRKYNYGITKEL